MKSPLHSLFQSLPEAELPTGLSGRIFAEVTRVREREMRRALFLSQMRVLISGVVSLNAIFFAGSSILGSEFAQLFSLILSDTMAMTAYGKELFWLFLETFPTLSFVLLFIPIFLFLVSLGMHATVKNQSQFSRVLSL